MLSTNGTSHANANANAHAHAHANAHANANDATSSVRSNVLSSQKMLLSHYYINIL